MILKRDSLRSYTKFVGIWKTKFIFEKMTCFDEGGKSVAVPVCLPRHGYIGFAKVGNDICSGIPVGNSRRLRDYSRHPLREYIIAWRVYVSSYDRHFRFRRALLTSFRFWPRINVFTSRCRLSFRVLPSRGERCIFLSLSSTKFPNFPIFRNSDLCFDARCFIFSVNDSTFQRLDEQRSAINLPRDASSQLLIRK